MFLCFEPMIFIVTVRPAPPPRIQHHQDLHAVIYYQLPHRAKDQRSQTIASLDRGLEDWLIRLSVALIVLSAFFYILTLYTICDFAF